MIDYDVLLHSTICALDTDGFLAPREELVPSFLRHGGRVVLRNVTFHFDDTIEEGLRLWERQDRLMRGSFGVFGDLRPEVLENPARLIRGKKQRNPQWKVVGDWAYFKAPTTKDHKFSPHNHNWTAATTKDAYWSPSKKSTNSASNNIWIFSRCSTMSIIITFLIYHFWLVNFIESHCHCDSNDALYNDDDIK